MVVSLTLVLSCFLSACLLTVDGQQEELDTSARAVRAGSLDETPDPLTAYRSAAAFDERTVPSAVAHAPTPWPAGQVVVPATLFPASGGSLNRAVMESNPRLFSFPDFDPSLPPILVIGMPGWGGRSENFIWTLINSAKTDRNLRRRLVIASIQDTDNNGGPRYQGQGDREHANIWSVTTRSVQVMRHFVSRISNELGRLEVTFIGFSTGGVSAPMMAARLEKARPATSQFRVTGSVALGTGTRVPGDLVRDLGQRVLIVIVPGKHRDDQALRDDQVNRQSGEFSYRLLREAGASVELRHVHSARKHPDWHWGLISQCRFFASTRIDDGRGYWPNYWMPNPETSAAIVAFLNGHPIPAEGVQHVPTGCPY